MTTGTHLLPGTRALAKNLLVEATAIVKEVYSTPDPTLIAGMVQALAALKIAEQPIGQ